MNSKTKSIISNAKPPRPTEWQPKTRRRRAWGWYSCGFTYTEVLLSSIIMAVLIVSAMKLFANLGRSRQNVVRDDVAGYLALQMIEEIKQQYYQDPVIEGEDGPGGDETGPDRSDFDDVDDYHNWSSRPPQDRDGNPLNQYADYLREVEVHYVAANDFTQVAGSNEGFKRVRICIKRQNAQGVDEELEKQTYVIADAPGIAQR